MIEMKFTFSTSQEAAEFLAKIVPASTGPRSATAVADYLQLLKAAKPAPAAEAA